MERLSVVVILNEKIIEQMRGLVLNGLANRLGMETRLYLYKHGGL